MAEPHSATALSPHTARTPSASYAFDSQVRCRAQYHSVHCNFRRLALAQPHSTALIGRGIDAIRPFYLAVKQPSSTASSSSSSSTDNPALAWTYSGLAFQVQAWADVLGQRWEDLLGYGSSFRVGIYLPRSVDSLILMLACLKLGVTMVPLDVHYPPVKTIQMIHSARLNSIVTISPPLKAGATAAGQPQAPSYPSIEQLTVLAQQSASNPISDLVADVQLLDLGSIASAAALHISDATHPQTARELNRPCACLDGAGRSSPAMMNAAYLLFTSGSTGLSKAVPYSYLQLSIHLDALRHVLPLEPSDVFVPMASFCFIAHNRLWLSLLSGSTLLLPSDTERTSILPFTALLRSLHDEHSLTLSILDTSPAFVRMLMQDKQGLMAASQGGPAYLLRWRRVYVAGEILTWKMVRAVYEAHDQYMARHNDSSQLQLTNLYGTTETASTSCLYTVPRSADAAPQSSFVPIGRPFPTVSIVLLSDEDQPLSPSSNVVGHVHVGGDRIELSAGYDRDANSTMTRFARHHQAGLAGRRLFRTGDLARWVRSPDGTYELELLGRSDNMVKVRGQRVELEELESTLAQSEQVSHAQVVAVRQDVHDEEVILLAFIVPTPQVVKDGLINTPLTFSTPQSASPLFAHSSLKQAGAGRMFNFPAQSNQSGPVSPALSSLAVPNSDQHGMPSLALDGRRGSGSASSSTASSALTVASASQPVPSATAIPNVPLVPLNSNSSALLKLASVLRTEVGRKHPFYYMPKHFVFVSALAQTPSGKLDRQAGKAAAAEWIGRRKAQEEAERKEKVDEEGEDEREDGNAPQPLEALNAALALQKQLTDRADNTPATRPSSQLLHRYASLLNTLSAMERALWGVWLHVFTTLTSRQQVEVLQAVSSTKRGTTDTEVNNADDFDFFALGGDSLRANQLISFLMTEPSIARDMSVRQVFEFPNLIQMAAFLETAPAAAATAAGQAAAKNESSAAAVTDASPAPALPSISGVDASGRPYVDYPMSAAQSGLWFAGALAGRPLPAHHISQVYSVQRTGENNDRINMRALETSLQFLIQRHDALRTIFPTVAGSAEPKQRVLSAGAATGFVPSGSALPPLGVKVRHETVETVQSVHRVVESIDHTTFQLDKWPLFHVTLFTVKPQMVSAMLKPITLLERASSMSERPTSPHHRTRNMPASTSFSEFADSAGSDEGVSEMYLSLTIHHLISDGWSSGMLLRELSQCYAHFSNPNSSRRYSIATANTHPSLPNRAAMQYVQFQALNEAALAADKNKQQLAYWTRELKDAAYLELPTDFTRPLTRSFEGDMVHRDMPSSISSALHALTLSSRCSLFNLLLASLQLLLSKYAQQEDVVIGTASANRDSSSEQQVMGYCINMVACRTTVDQRQSFLTHAKKVQNKTLELIEHGRLPFSAVVSAVQKEAGSGAVDPSRNPLFDVVLVLQNQPIRNSQYALTSDGTVQLARVPFRASHSQFDLAFTLEPTANKQLMLQVNYNVQIFRRESIARMVDNWLHLLHNVTASPAVPMHQHEWISPPQRQTVLSTFNSRRTTPVPVDHPIQHYFEQHAINTPNALAVESWDDKWTYKQLDDKANQVANALLSAYRIRYGVELSRDTLIGLSLDRKAGMAMPAAVMGILKAGAAYVPLDPSFPESRLCYMVRNSELKLILSLERMQDTLTAMFTRHNKDAPADEQVPSVPVLCIDNILAADSPHPTSRPPCINGVSDLAYVIYTSGSTGQPKGVMVQHLGVINLARFMAPWMLTHHQKDGTKKAVVNPRCLQFSSISFDAAVYEWSTTFFAGGSLCLIPSVEHLLGEALLDTVARYGITMLLMSASSLAAVPLNSGPNGTCRVDLSRLSFMSTGSEALQETVLHRWMSACPAAFFNQYGPTEITVISNMCHYQPVTEFPYHNNKVIGASINNSHAYVCDEHMQPVPIGVTGELYVGGAGVTRGYLNRPDLTEQRFLPNPFISPDSEGGEWVAGVSTRTWESNRIYRTGDLVRWTVAGELEYMGRNDGQVKVRGFRIEIGEIEKRILEHRNVHTAAVVLRQEKQNGQEHPTPTLTCFFTAHQPISQEQLPAALTDLRQHCAAALAPYMVPTYFIHQHDIEQTPTGKFDRALLTKKDIQPYLQALRQTKSGKSAAASKPQQSPVMASRAARQPSQSESGLLEALRLAWSTALSIDADTLQLTDHFFEVGGHSLLTLRLVALLPAQLQPHLALTDIFAHPTLQGQLDLLKQKVGAQANLGPPHVDGSRSRSSSDSSNGPSVGDIAVIGMAGRFPGASSVQSLWQHLTAGDELIRTFTTEELLAAGVDEDVMAGEHYIRRFGVLGEQEADADVAPSHARSMFGFDSGFFEYSPKDAELMDPQQRHFLEVCHQALEDAGVVPASYQRAVDQTSDGSRTTDSEPTIGVFAGCGRNTYVADYLSSTYDVSGSASVWNALCMANDKDFLCSRVSYKLGLHGPACVIQTACSSSLVAVHSAMASLQRGECEVALAGGVSLGALHPQGYTYQPDHILSPDGHCRALDASASGTVRGQGVAVVVLKPLALALRDRDQIYSVIKASAINNDGSSKASYSAPNPDGQRRCIQQALRDCRPHFGPEHIQFVETHGTGTKIGDVIELTSLTKAWQRMHRRNSRRASKDSGLHASNGGLKLQYCAIGSTKTNIGHLDAAAGVTGLIKASLSVHHNLIPPSLHYTKPNPAVGMEQSPFYVAHGSTKPYPAEVNVRRAAISSFGIGGTNAHVIIEQAPHDEHDAAVAVGKELHTMCWSAKSGTSGAEMAQQLLHFFKAQQAKLNGEEAERQLLANAAFTLQTGRTHFTQYRQAVVASDLPSLVASLTTVAEQGTVNPTVPAPRTRGAAKATPIVFFFPGQGAHFAGMAAGLYAEDTHLHTIADECWQLIRSLPGLYPTLLPGVEIDVMQVDSVWADTASWLAPLALFTVEYAVCQRLRQAGVEPTAVCGHSLGHFLAAHVSGLVSLHQSLIMLLRRSHLLHTSKQATEADHGSMLSISAPVLEVNKLLADGVEVAGVNSPSNTVVAGSTAAISALSEKCTAAGVRSIKLHTSHAFHSSFIEHIMPDYTQTLQLMASTNIADTGLPSCTELPACALADTVTGTLSSGPSAFSVDYWVQHTRRAVLFQTAVTALAATHTGSVAPVCFEVGPGRTCVTLLQQTLDSGSVLSADFTFTAVQTLAGFADRRKKATKPDDATAEDGWHWRQALSVAWTKGAEVLWEQQWELDGQHSGVRKISLPVYVFDHSRLFCTPRARVGRQQQELSMIFPASPAFSSISSDGRQISGMSSAPYVETPSPMPTASQSGQLTLLSITGQVLQAFSSALGAPVQSLTADSDFFEEGGDSVSAVVLTAEINKRCQLAQLAPQSQVRTATLLVSRTVSELAQLVWKAVEGKAADVTMDRDSKPKQLREVLMVDTSRRTALKRQNSAISPVGSFASTLRSPVSASSSMSLLSPGGLSTRSLSAFSPAHAGRQASQSSASAFSHLSRQFGPLYVLQWGQLPSPYLPLVLVHAVGGDILSYRNLCAHLSPQQAVFAFRADSLDGSQPYESIQQQAAKYLDVLQAEDGPFRGYWTVRQQMMAAVMTAGRPLTPDNENSPTHSMSFLPVVADEMRIALGGHSYGGLVAYEMACQLQARRHTGSGSFGRSSSNSDLPQRISVAFSASVDSPDSDSDSSARGSLSDIESRQRSESPTDMAVPLCVQRLVLIDAPAPECLPPALTDAAAVNAYIQTNRIGGAAAQPTDKPVQVSEDVVGTWLAHQKAMRDYTWPQPNAADRQRCDEVEGTLFIRPTDRVHADTGKTDGVGSVGTAFYTAWLDVASEGLTVSKVSGNHLSMMMQPHVQQVASKVAAFTTSAY